MVFNSHKSVKGFTLIELLIAMALGVALSFGLVQIFQSSSNIAKTETALSRVQEVGRFAVDLLSKDLRMVGYHGCSDPDEMEVTVMADDGVGDFTSTTLVGYEVASNGAFSPALVSGDSLEDIQLTTVTGTISARPGSDVLRMKYASQTGAELTGNTDPVNANVQVDSNPTGIKQNDLAIISDCNSAHIFQVTNTPSSGATTLAHAGSNNTPHKMLPGYSAGAKLLTFTDVTYFVADTGRNTTAGDDLYALYRIVNGGAVEELLEGVEFLQLQYGEHLGTGNVRFYSADTAGLDLNEVKAVRLGLLVQSVEPGLPEADGRTYSVAGTDIAATGSLAHGGGRYVRKPFIATVQLRNRRFN